MLVLLGFERERVFLSRWPNPNLACMARSCTHESNDGAIMWNILVQHQFLAGVVAMWVFSALCYALPNPTAASPTYYIFLYRLVHFIGANLARAGLVSHPPKLPAQAQAAPQGSKAA
jgi:hypothetical protein